CDEVRGPDGPGPEAQMRDRDRAGLLAVVYEVALGVASRFLTDDLDGVLVRPDGAVGAEAVEDRAHGVRRLRREPGVPGKARVGDVVVDADREPVARRRRAELVEHRLDHARRELLRGAPITSYDASRLRAMMLCRRCDRVRET